MVQSKSTYGQHFSLFMYPSEVCTSPMFILVRHLSQSDVCTSRVRRLKARRFLYCPICGSNICTGTGSSLEFLFYFKCCLRNIFIHHSFIIYQFIYDLKHLTRNNYRGMTKMMILHRFNIKNPVLTITPL